MRYRILAVLVLMFGVATVVLFPACKSKDDGGGHPDATCKGPKNDYTITVANGKATMDTGYCAKKKSKVTFTSSDCKQIDIQNRPGTASSDLFDKINPVNDQKVEATINDNARKSKEYQVTGTCTLESGFVLAIQAHSPPVIIVD